MVSPSVASAASTPPAPPTPLVEFWRAFSANKGAVFGLVVVCVLLLLALFAPWIAPHAPFQTNSGAFLVPPAWQAGGSSTYLLGTDAIGRDILSRLIYGSRLSLSIGAVVVLIALALGVTLGLIAGFYRGLLEIAIMLTLLPEPDSPTIPSTSPACTCRLTPSTACITASCVGNSTLS